MLLDQWCRINRNGERWSNWRAGVLFHQFAEKLDAIVGLYLNPPEHAIVLFADEKSQIQALDRTQPGLPLPPHT